VQLEEAGARSGGGERVGKRGKKLLPRILLLCGASQALKGERPTDERFFVERVLSASGEVLIELGEGARGVAEAIEI
jgi:hypothetical protein